MNGGGVAVLRSPRYQAVLEERDAIRTALQTAEGVIGQLRQQLEDLGRAAAGSSSTAAPVGGGLPAGTGEGVLRERVSYE